MKRFGGYLLLMLLLPILYLVGFLPWKIQRFLALPFSCLAPFSKRWRIVRKNLDFCFPALTPYQSLRMAFRNFHHISIMPLALANVWHRKSIITRHVNKIEGIDLILDCQKNKQGCLLLGAHFVAMDVANIALSEHIRFGAIYQPSTDPLLNSLMGSMRKKINQPLFDKYSIKSMVRFLRDGGTLWYPIDQNYGGKMKGQVNFFKHRVNTLISLHRLRELGKAKLFPCSFFYNNGGYEIKIHPPFVGHEKATPLELTQMYFDFVEQMARQHPEQYYWVHRRFKSCLTY